MAERMMLRTSAPRLFSMSLSMVTLLLAARKLLWAVMTVPSGYMLRYLSASIRTAMVWVESPETTPTCWAR